MDAVQTAKAISFRESQSELLLDLALQAKQKSEELTQTSQEQMAALRAVVEQTSNAAAEAVGLLKNEVEKLPSQMSRETVEGLRMELAEMTGTVAQRLETATTRAINAPIENAQASLTKLQAQADAIKLPSADKKIFAVMASIAIAATVIGTGAGYGFSKLLTPKPTEEVKRQMQAGADILRVWGDLPSATRDDLIKRFSKR